MEGGKIVQVAPVGKLKYGCGPKGNPPSFAQVEPARTNDKEQFVKDYAAYIWLLRELAKEAFIPVVLDGTGNSIKSHRWITDNLKGKTHRDPYSYLARHGDYRGTIQTSHKEWFKGSKRGTRSKSNA